MQWYLGVILESEAKLSTGSGGNPCQNEGQNNCLFMLILNKYFEMLKSLNPRHTNKYVVWILLKRLFPWNLIKSYIVYKTKPRLVGGRKIHSGYISKRLSLAGLKLLHWNHSNGIFWLGNKVALSLFNFSVLSAVSCFLLHWQLFTPNQITLNSGMEVHPTKACMWGVLCALHH